MFLSLTWKSPHLGKTVFILRQGPGNMIWYDSWDIIFSHISMVAADGLVPEAPGHLQPSWWHDHSAHRANTLMYIFPLSSMLHVYISGIGHHDLRHNCKSFSGTIVISQGILLADYIYYHTETKHMTWHVIWVVLYVHYFPIIMHMVHVLCYVAISIRALIQYGHAILPILEIPLWR